MAEKQLELVEDLTPAEQNERIELENKVVGAVTRFYLELGEILTTIRDKRLYRSTHGDFDSYCREVLDMAKRTADRYVGAYHVAQNLKLIENDASEIYNELSRQQNGTNWSHLAIPQNESQARALVGLSPDDQRKAWLEALRTAPDTKITAAHIRQTVKRLLTERLLGDIEAVANGEEVDVEVDPKAKKPRLRKPNQKERISGEMQMAINQMVAIISGEVKTNWRTTDRKTCVQRLDSLRNLIAANADQPIHDLGFDYLAGQEEKLIEAGFKIYRANLEQFYIEIMTNRGWELHSSQGSKEETEKDMAELLRDLKALRG